MVFVASVGASRWLVCVSINKSSTNTWAAQWSTGRAFLACLIVQHLHPGIPFALDCYVMTQHGLAQV